MMLIYRLSRIDNAPKCLSILAPVFVVPTRLCLLWKKLHHGRFTYPCQNPKFAIALALDAAAGCSVHEISFQKNYPTGPLPR